jgi:hypothetical protein
MLDLVVHVCNSGEICLRETKVPCVEDRSTTNTSFIIYTYKCIQNMFPKVGLLEELRKEKKKKGIIE